ncbi:MAG TPA: M56 family metallopeptidase [Thermoanaerobaculia bacterium]|nr:M56 family metallopeptidase [Thermoanaerobaculia bacterium]
MTLLAAKATLAILIALAVGAAARRARASLRHAVYAAMFAVLMTLPFAPKLTPELRVAVPAAIAVPRPASGHPLPASGARDLQRDPLPARAERNYLMDVYFAGVFLMLASLAAGVVRLRRWAANGEVWLDGTRLATDVACANGIRRAVLVVISDEVTTPMTFGFRRQTIVLPAGARDWDDDSLRRALRHELEHVRRDDWAMQLFARAVCAMYWPHPLVWVAWRRFCAEAERACDDAVVGMFEPATYAEQLVTLARTLRRRPRVPALAMASPTRLSERVHAILDASQPRGPHGRIASVATVVMMAAALVVFGSVRLVAAARATDDGMRDAVREGVDGALEHTDDYVAEAAAIKAAQKGNIERLAQLFGNGLDINTTFDGDGTALLIAARHGRYDAVRYLLAHGADPNVPSPGDGNPLIAAAEGGQTAIVELLLDRGARIDEVVPGDENALITACAAGHADVVRLLVARGADVNLRVWADGREWRSPMIMARRGHYDDVIRILGEAGAK